MVKNKDNSVLLLKASEGLPNKSLRAIQIVGLHKLKNIITELTDTLKRQNEAATRLTIAIFIFTAIMVILMVVQLYLR
jgi:hypothetical protein